MPDLTGWTRPLRALGQRPSLAAGIVVGLATGLATATGLAIGTWKKICYDCPSVAEIYTWEPQQSTKILSHDGQLLGELGVERRTFVALSDLPSYVPLAFIAIEDKRFYEHNGFDPRGTLRAARDMVLARFRIVGGGSTITQQLARNMFAELGFEQRFRRKLKELRVALELEQVYPKDQILEAYLNQVNYGPGWWGIETAAQRYFGKPAWNIDPAEAAMLAAVINLPGEFSPFVNPELARARRNLVLSLMAEQGFLSRSEAERWQQAPLPEQAHGGDDGNLAPHFVESVRTELNDRFGTDLYRRGFRVYTTLDVDLQRKAREAMDAGWARIEAAERFEHPTYAEIMENGGSGGASETEYLQGSFVAFDTETGEIRAMIGGRDFRDSRFNRAVQARRQPGSVFKPFVYAAAIASGIPASHVIDDSPYILDQPDGSEWAPRNFGGEFRGPTTLREALRHSVNVVTVKLGAEVGIETVAQFARRFGVRTQIPRVESITIGSASVIPLQIAEAYTPFATGGVRVQPRSILRVEDAEGRTLWEPAPPEREQVLDPPSAYIMLDMLRGVVNEGSAIRIRTIVPPDLPIAGKTGTTNDDTDVWFVGFTPDLVAATWFGFDQRQTIMPDAQGGRHAAPVFADFARSVYLDGGPGQTLRPMPEPWEEPEALIRRRVDMETGKVATPYCPIELIYTELFVPGTEPTEECDLHGEGIFDRPAQNPFRVREPPPDTIREQPQTE